MKKYFFFPANAGWERKLTSIEAFHCGMYPKGCFYFDGGVDLELFIRSLQIGLNDFSFLYSKIHIIGDEVIAKYKNDSSVQLEVEYQSKMLEAIPSLQALPQGVDTRMHSGVTDDIEGLPMVAFKLTIAVNGFILGYCINHAFIDQASLFYFIKYLSHVYSGEVSCLKKPVLADIENLCGHEDAPVSLDLNQFRSNAEKVGLKHVPCISELYANPLSIANNQVYLHLNTSRLETLKQQSRSRISKNDIMHGILLKMYSQDSILSDDSEMHFGFACNMRKMLGLGEEYMGNILHFPYMEAIKVANAKKLDISELAEISRKNVNAIRISDYQEKIRWFKALRAHRESAIQYVPLPYVDSCFWGHTNWASFSYQDIAFQKSQVLALWTPPFPANLKFTVTLFDRRDNESSLVIPLNLSDQLLSKVYEMAKNTELFSVKSDSQRC